MATRAYKNYSDYNPAQRHFAFNTVGENTYLVIGSLSANDQTFVATVLSNQYVGFFQNDAEVAYRRVTANYDATNGIQVGELNGTLTIDAEYEIRFQQARSGDATPVDGEDGADAKVQYRACPALLNRTCRVFEQIGVAPDNIDAGEFFVTHDVTEGGAVSIWFPVDDPDIDTLETLESPDLIRLIHDDIDAILEVINENVTSHLNLISYNCTVLQAPVAQELFEEIFEDGDDIEIRVYKGEWTDTKEAGYNVVRFGTGDPVEWENLIDLCVVDGKDGRNGIDGQDGETIYPWSSEFGGA